MYLPQFHADLSGCHLFPPRTNGFHLSSLIVVYTKAMTGVDIISESRFNVAGKGGVN